MADKGKTLVGTPELAKLFGLSDRRIQQLTADGTISAEVVTVNGHKVRRYDLFPTVHSYIASLQDKLKAKGSRTDREIELRQQKLEAEIALKESQGELHRLKTAIAAGKYIDVDEVALDYQKFFAAFKRFALSIPSKLVGMVSDSIEPLEARRVEKEMNAEVRRMLRAFIVAGHTQEPGEKKPGKGHAKT